MASPMAVINKIIDKINEIVVEPHSIVNFDESVKSSKILNEIAQKNINNLNSLEGVSEKTILLELMIKEEKLNQIIKEISKIEDECMKIESNFLNKKRKYTPRAKKQSIEN